MSSFTIPSTLGESPTASGNVEVMGRMATSKNNVFDVILTSQFYAGSVQTIVGVGPVRFSTSSGMANLSALPAGTYTIE